MSRVDRTAVRPQEPAGTAVQLDEPSAAENRSAAAAPNKAPHGSVVVVPMATPALNRIYGKTPLRRAAPPPPPKTAPGAVTAGSLQAKSKVDPRVLLDAPPSFQVVPTGEAHQPAPQPTLDEELKAFFVYGQVPKNSGVRQPLQLSASAPAGAGTTTHERWAELGRMARKAGGDQEKAAWATQPSPGAQAFAEHYPLEAALSLRAPRGACVEFVVDWLAAAKRAGVHGAELERRARAVLATLGAREPTRPSKYNTAFPPGEYKQLRDPETDRVIGFAYNNKAAKVISIFDLEGRPLQHVEPPLAPPDIDPIDLVAGPLTAGGRALAGAAIRGASWGLLSSSLRASALAHARATLTHELGALVGTRALTAAAYTGVQAATQAAVEHQREALSSSAEGREFLALYDTMQLLLAAHGAAVLGSAALARARELTSLAKRIPGLTREARAAVDQALDTAVAGARALSRLESRALATANGAAHGLAVGPAGPDFQSLFRKALTERYTARATQRLQGAGLADEATRAALKQIGKSADKLSPELVAELTGKVATLAATDPQAARAYVLAAADAIAATSSGAEADLRLLIKASTQQRRLAPAQFLREALPVLQREPGELMAMKAPPKPAGGGVEVDDVPIHLQAKRDYLKALGDGTAHRDATVGFGEFAGRYQRGLCYNLKERSWERLEGSGNAKPREQFGQQVTFAEAKAKLASGSFGPYSGMLKGELGITDAQLDEALHRLHAQGKVAGATVESVRRALRRQFEPAVLARIEHGTLQEQHRHLLEVTRTLAPADRGSLAEVWYTRAYARGAVRQVELDPSTVSGAQLSAPRKADFLDGETLGEIKNVRGKLKGRDVEQLGDQLRVAESKHGVSFPHKGKTLHAKTVEYVFIDPEGGVANLDMMISKAVRLKSGRLRLTLFNPSGERATLLLVGGEVKVIRGSQQFATTPTAVRLWLQGNSAI